MRNDLSPARRLTLQRERLTLLENLIRIDEELGVSPVVLNSLRDLATRYRTQNSLLEEEARQWVESSSH